MEAEILDSSVTSAGTKPGDAPASTLATEDKKQVKRNSGTFETITPLDECGPEAALARTIIHDLIQKGIRMLALDFDKTIVSIHTAGYWRGGTPALAEYVRSCFRYLLHTALESSLHVCIVTYSTQPLLIRDVLKMILPKTSDISKLTIRANSKDWPPTTELTGIANTGLSFGKQEHIAWAVTELFNKRHVIIEPHEILLMDDDVENVETALEFGHQAFEVSEDVNLEAMKAYADGLHVVKHMPSPNL